MDKIKSFVEEKIVPFVDKATNNRYVKIMMNGFMGISALTIGASFFVLVRSLPLGDWYTAFLQNTGLYDLLNLPILITSELTSLYLIIALGYFTATSFDKKGINGSLIALGSFLMLTPQETGASLVSEAGEVVSGVVGSVLPVSSFGATGIFLALIVSIVSVRIYVWMDDKNIKIRMPASVPSNVTNMFETMIPAALIFIIFLCVRLGCQATPFGTAQNLIYGVLQAPLSKVGNGFWAVFIYVMIGNVMWLFGVHGQMLAYVGMAPILMAAWTENTMAFASGMPAPNPAWMYPLYYTVIGGSGCTLALCLMMALRAKSKHLKTLGKIALPTSLFNINEPLAFGTPLIMNPITAIPYLVAPVANFFIILLLNSVGFATVTGAQINVYLPIFFLHAMASVKPWQGVVAALICFVVDAVIWYPFFKALDAKKLKEEEEYEASEEEDDLL